MEDRAVILRRADKLLADGEKDKSINGLINNFLRESLGMTEAEWKQISNDAGDA